MQGWVHGRGPGRERSNHLEEAGGFSPVPAAVVSGRHLLQVRGRPRGCDALVKYVTGLISSAYPK